MDHVVRINEEIKTAMLGGDKLRLETLRSVRAGIIEFEKNGSGKSLGDEEFLKIISGNVKKRKDAIEQFRSAGRTELMNKEEAELAILMEFMPTQLSAEDVELAVTAIAQGIASQGTCDFKTLMPAVMKELKGKADGAVIQAAVKKAVGQ
ncbi:MAG: GatB/YqeY domain-containing protein [Candidatus Kapaibacterium sp.]